MKTLYVCMNEHYCTVATFPQEDGFRRCFWCPERAVPAIHPPTKPLYECPQGHLSTETRFPDGNDNRKCHFDGKTVTEVEL